MSISEFEEIRRSYGEARSASAVKALAGRGFDAKSFGSRGEAIDHILEVIPRGSRVGAGGSVTLHETGILNILAGRGDSVIYHRSGMDPEDNLRIRREAITCPYYLSSSNAITMEGELINIDGIGNRVAGMIFGPKTVIVMAGINKLVADREEALSRIKNVAAPANARRLGLEVPCTEKGYCVNCRSPLNICRVTTIISHRPFWTDIKVLLINETLGL